MPVKRPNVMPSQIRLCGGEGSAELIAAAPAKDGEAAGVPGFKMIAYTGGPMMVGRFAFPVVVDLTGCTVTAKSRPILRDHDSARIVGHSEQINIAARQILVSGLLSAANEHSAEIVNAGKNKFPWQASIGGLVTAAAYVDEGEKVTVNGKTFTGPLIVARKFTLQEVSFVALGADDRTSAFVTASAAENQTVEVQAMNFEAWLAANNWKKEDLSDAQLATLQAAFDAEQGDPEPTPPQRKPKPKAKPKKVTAKADPDEDEEDDDAPGDPVRQINAESAAALRRVRQISDLCAKYGDPMIEIEAAGGAKQQVLLSAHAIEQGWSTEKVELTALRESRPSGPAIHSGGSAPSGAVLEASILMSAGYSETQIAARHNKGQIGQWYDDKTMEAALSSEWRGSGLHTAMHECIRAAGHHYRVGQVDNGFIEAAFRADKVLRASGTGVSTLSLSGVLGNVANKSLLASYLAVETVWQLFCSIADHSDFKQHTKYRLTGTGEFKQVGPNGELELGSLSEESFSNQLDTFGIILALTRKTQIDDDLGAFLQIPRLLGRQGAIGPEKAFFTLLLANTGSFFSTGNKNYIEGATKVLNIDTLTELEALFLNQVDSNGDPVMIMPKYLLTPTTLKVTAESLHTETIVNQTPASNAAKPRNNPHAGKFQPVSSPFLNAQSLSGSSSVAHYLFSDPADVAAFEMAFLRGRRVPVLESSEADFDTLGMKWRGYHDWGVAQQDKRAAVMSKGEA